MTRERAFFLSSRVKGAIAKGLRPRPLRHCLRNATVPTLSPVVTFLPGTGRIFPKVGGLGNPRKVCGFARGSPFGRAGTLVPERASTVKKTKASVSFFNSPLALSSSFAAGGYSNSSWNNPPRPKKESASFFFCAPTEPVYTLQESLRPSAEVAVITA